MDEAAMARARGRLKASMTKIEKFVDTIYGETTANEIDVRLQRIDGLLSEFVRIDDALGAVPGYNYEFDEFEDRATAVKVCLSQSKENAIQLNTTILPRININSFSGDYRDWPSFSDQFAKIKDEQRLSGIQKLTYLRSYLDPEPKLLIEKLAIINENFDIAWNKLNKRYNNKRKIVASYVEAFVDLKPVRDGVAGEIRKITDNLENIVSGLDAIDPTKCRDVWLIHIVRDKLDSTTKRLWAERVIAKYDNSDNDEFPTIDELLQFLDDRRAILESDQVDQRRPNNAGRNR